MKKQNVTPTPAPALPATVRKGTAKEAVEAQRANLPQAEAILAAANITTDQWRAIYDAFQLSGKQCLYAHFAQFRTPRLDELTKAELIALLNAKQGTK